jgi:hypothetical protein
MCVSLYRRYVSLDPTHLLSFIRYLHITRYSQALECLLRCHSFGTKNRGKEERGSSDRGSAMNRYPRPA